MQLFLKLLSGLEWFLPSHSERERECSAALAAVKLPAELHRYWTILHYRAHLMSAHKSLLAEQVSV